MHVSFCRDAKTVSTVCINACSGLFGVWNIKIGIYNQFLEGVSSILLYAENWGPYNLHEYRVSTVL